jgi:hypothetical protein
VHTQEVKKFPHSIKRVKNLVGDQHGDQVCSFRLLDDRALTL